MRLVLLIAVLLAAAPAWASRFVPLGNVGGDRAWEVTALSADGSVAILHGSAPQGGRRSYRWSRASGGVQPWPPVTLPAGETFVATDLSADGSTVVGQIRRSTGGTGVEYDSFAAIWNRAAGLTVLDAPEAPAEPSMFSAVSADGLIALGQSAGSGHFLWSRQDGMTPVGIRAEDLSGDGETVAGYVTDGPAGMRPAAWSASSGRIDLGDQAGFATHVSHNGKLTAGVLIDSEFQPFVAAADEPIEPLPLPAGGSGGTVGAMSANGRYIVGNSNAGSFVWSADLGTRLLAQQIGGDPLVAAGSWGWTKHSASAVSDNGHTLAGQGNDPSGQPAAWLAIFGPEPIPGDANADGRVDLSDFITLKANFGSGRSWSYGDFTGDGHIALADFIVLKSSFGRRAAVPEPSAGLLALVGLGALLAARRVRARQLCNRPAAART